MARSIMTYWPAMGGFNPFSVDALPHCMHPPIASSCYRRTPKPERLPKDLGEYMVYVTREALVATATTLGKASSETHDAFLRVNQTLAVDRMARNVFPWAAGTSGWPSYLASSAVPDPFTNFGKSAPALTAAMSLSAAFLKFSPLMAPAATRPL